MAERRIGLISKRWLLLAVLAFAVVAVACNGGDGESPTPEPSVTTTTTDEPTLTVLPTLTPTALPSPTSTSVPPVALPAPLPSPTQIQSIAPQITCPTSHLNIELLGAQPGMEEAVITEVADSSIRVELFDNEIIIIGTGDSIHIHADLSNDELDQISTAVDAVRYEC